MWPNGDRAADIGRFVNASVSPPSGATPLYIWPYGNLPDGGRRVVYDSRR